MSDEKKKNQENKVGVDEYECSNCWHLAAHTVLNEKIHCFETNESLQLVFSGHSLC